MALNEEELFEKLKAAEIRDGLGNYRLKNADGISRVFEHQDAIVRLQDGWEPDSPADAAVDAYVPAAGFAEGDYRMTRGAVTNVVPLEDVPGRLASGWTPADEGTTKALVERGIIEDPNPANPDEVPEPAGEDPDGEGDGEGEKPEPKPAPVAAAPPPAPPAQPKKTKKS